MKEQDKKGNDKSDECADYGVEEHGSFVVQLACGCREGRSSMPTSCTMYKRSSLQSYATKKKREAAINT